MPKQSGLHQIIGKHDGVCYYRQTGVKEGLFRNINPGLSKRVKTAKEFANTRRNMAEFGQAGRIAGLYGKLVVPKWRPMFLAFSQSKLQKKVVALIKESTGNWGQRSVAAASLPLVAGYLSDMSKLAISDLCSITDSGFSVTAGTGTTLVINASLDVTADNFANLSSFDAAGMFLKLVVSGISVGNYKAAIHDYVESVILNQVAADTDVDSVDSVTLSANINKPVSADGSAALVAVLIAMPYKTINSQQHILQEQCRFIAFDITAKMPA